MKVWDILRITEDTPGNKAGTCHKILWITDTVYIISGSWNPRLDKCEPSRKTKFEEDMVVKLNERWMEAWSTKAWYQLPKDSYARVVKIWEWNIQVQRVNLNGSLTKNRYKRHHLDICPHMSYWYERDTIKNTETLLFFEWPAKKPTVVSAFKVWDKIRVRKPTENKEPNRVDNMNMLDNNILTIKKITYNNYILVKENSREFHPDRCTPIDTKTSGLGLHVICKPFNLLAFRELDKYKDIDVHKNNPTILFAI